MHILFFFFVWSTSCMDWWMRIISRYSFVRQGYMWTEIHVWRTYSFIPTWMHADIHTYITCIDTCQSPSLFCSPPDYQEGTMDLYHTVDENYSSVVHMVYSVRTYKILAMPIGAGCCPSTVCTCFQVLLFILINNIAMYLRVCLTYLYIIFIDAPVHPRYVSRPLNLFNPYQFWVIRSANLPCGVGLLLDNTEKILVIEIPNNPRLMIFSIFFFVSCSWIWW